MSTQTTVEPGSSSTRASAARPAAEEGSHRLEPVGRQQAPGDPVPEGIGDLDRHAAGNRAQVGEEQGASLLQGSEDIGGSADPRLLRSGACPDRRRRWSGARSFGANLCVACDTDAIGGKLATSQRQTPETHLPSPAQLVQEGCLVAGDASGENRGLPRFDRSLGALQLLNHIGEAGGTDEPVPRTGMLPRYEEAHQLLG